MSSMVILIIIITTITISRAVIDKDMGSVVRIDRVRLLISVRTTRHLHLVSLSLYKQQQQIVLVVVVTTSVPITIITWT